MKRKYSHNTLNPPLSPSQTLNYKQRPHHKRLPREVIPEQTGLGPRSIDYGPEKYNQNGELAVDDRDASVCRTYWRESPWEIMRPIVGGVKSLHMLDSAIGIEKVPGSVEPEQGEEDK